MMAGTSAPHVSRVTRFVFYTSCDGGRGRGRGCGSAVGVIVGVSQGRRPQGCANAGKKPCQMSMMDMGLHRGREQVRILG